MHKALPSTTLYYEACTKHFPVLLCTTKLAQSTSQYYFVLQSLHKALPCTTLYDKACAKHFPVLLCATKLAQSTFQHYFVLQSLHKALPSTSLYYKACTQYYLVLQSLHKALPSTTLYYKACAKHFPVLLCTTKLAQARPSTTLYYKPCTKHFPVLLCTTKLAHRKLLHTASSFAEKLLHTASFLNREAFTHRSFYTQQALTQRSFSPQRAFTHSKRLHTEHFTQSAFTHGKRLHTQKLLHRQAFTHSKLLQKIVFTQRSFLVQNDNRNWSSKTSTPKRKKYDFEALLKRTFKKKIASAKIEKICWQITVAALMQPLQYYLRDPAQHSCSHYNAFCSITWLTRMYLRTWQQSMTTTMQPFQWDLQPELQETNYAHRNNHPLQNTEEEPIRAWNDPSRTRRTHEVPFITGCSHFARKNPKQSPCNIHAAITMRFAASRGLPACIYAHGNTRW